MPGPRNAPKRKSPFSFLLILALIGAILTVFTSSDEPPVVHSGSSEKISLSELIRRYKKQDLEKIEIKDNKITAYALDGQVFLSHKESSANIGDLGLSDPQNPTQVEIIDTSGGKFWTNILIGVAPFLLLILFLIFLSRRAGSMGGENGPFGFGKSQAKTYDRSKNRTKFAEVAGAEEAKEDVMEVVDFLKNPKKYQRMGAKIPTGILLVGPPGTGKTLLARAIAGEANVPFFSVSGSEFVEMFVGVGASRVRDLFKTAKRNAPSIIFIDEIDAIGKKRGQGQGGGHDEREQTLNQILTEMDGFESETSVIVLAATNRPDVLDKALLRPGRFDRRVQIDLPDMEARLKILEVHAKNKTFAPKTEFKKVASKTVGFSGADLENVLNESAIAAVKHRQKNITEKDLSDAVEKVSMGPERRSRRITQSEREIIAYHEVGHAISGHLCENCEPVHKVSIIARGGALGVTWFLPTEDTYLRSEAKMRDDMVSLHGGRVAERLIFGQTTTGASNDLERITNIARNMVMTYGMGDVEKVGPVVFAPKARLGGWDEYLQKEYSEETARKIDQNVQKLVLEAEARCVEILKKELPLLKKISLDLLEKENISEEEFLAYFKKA